MKKQIRFGVFETNSSSTHSMTIATVAEAKGLENGTILIDSDGDLVPAEEAKVENIKYAREDGVPEEIISAYESGEKSVNEFFKDLQDFGLSICHLSDGYFLPFDMYDCWMTDERWLDRVKTTYTTEHGDKIVIYCWYGREG